MKFLFVFSLAFILFSCQTSYTETKVDLSPYVLEEGFKLEVVAAEPLLEAPVAMDFDAQGRIWVVQMPGYMNDMQGSGEDKPTGSIQILEDRDDDGIADHAKVFLDSLIMPRALAHVYGGLLYAEPPNLWFVDIENDKPVNPVLVDSSYAEVGNPEHQPNGLLLNIDNWIYNAKSNYRYQRKDGVWKKEPTTFRGQWGISRDNFGRLYYNDNSRQLLGDYVLPNTMVHNEYYTPKVGVNKMLTNNQRVYPLHATTVNRGYSKGVLNKDSILINTTSACSPLVYLGDVFPKTYMNNNVFVCIPEGNLVKRNVLTFSGDSTIAKQVWDNKEFLAATDEGFRPVSLNNGPDGSLYVVDMHRGMIGHHAYLSPYLKKKVEKTRLDTIVNFGRILKVSPVDKKTSPNINFDKLNSSELVDLLSSKNGWIRGRAQHYLIFKEMQNELEAVKRLGLDAENEFVQIHALRILDGWNALSFEYLIDVAKKSKNQTVAHALVLGEQFISKENEEKAAEFFKGLEERNSALVDLYLGNTLGGWLKVNEGVFYDLAAKILVRNSNRPVVKEAFLSGLGGAEKKLIEHLEELPSFTDTDFKKELLAIIENREAQKPNPIYKGNAAHEDTRTAGAKMFYSICASCHGINGQGIEGLAPPLINSKYVRNPKVLALIILHGLEGPVEVDGKLYDYNLAMPGLIRNDKISNKNIVDIISYVSNAFSDSPKILGTKIIDSLRSVKAISGNEFTEKELEEF